MKKPLNTMTFALLVFFITSVTMSVQAFNPPYLSQFPPVEKVMKEETTSDPKQTALLQITAFTELVELIKALAGPREFRAVEIRHSRCARQPDERPLFRTTGKRFSTALPSGLQVQRGEDSGQLTAGKTATWPDF
jgi:hypothetical protein